MKKIRYIIKASNQSITIIIYINHDVALDITKQILFFTSFTNKFNFRLIKISNYIQRFNFDIRHKFDKQHIMSNTFFRLINDNINVFDYNDELNALFTISLIKINLNFKQRILNDYKSNFN